MPKGKPATLEEMPISDLRDEMANYEQVSLKITRRNEKGQIATVYSDVIMTLEEILDLDGWLKSNAGGGRYRIEVRNPQDKSKYIVPPFHVGVEGPPRPPRFLGNPAHMGGMPTPPYTSPVVPGDPSMTYDPNNPPPPGYGNIQHTPFYGHTHQPPPSPWAHGLHPSQRTYMMPSTLGRGGESPAPGATVASDALAIRQLEEQKAEAKAQIAKLEEQNKALNEKIDRLLDEMKADREKAREERHRLEMEAIRKEMALAREAPKSGGMGETLAGLAPFAPVLASMITARESTGAKSMELQQQALVQLMNATLSQANRPDQTMEMFKSVVLPMLLKDQEAKSPAAQAQLFNSMVENNLNSVAMMAQLIEAFANSGGEEPWWLPMVRETMTGVVGMTEAYMQGRGGLPGQQRPLPEPNPAALPPGAPQQIGMSGYSTVDLDAPISAPMQAASPPAVRPEPVVEHRPAAMRPAPEPTPAPAPAVSHDEEDYEGAYESIDDLLSSLLENATPVQRVMLTQLPDDFQTKEWKIIVLALHQSDDAEEVANLIAGHLAHLMNFRALPKALGDLPQDPARALDRLLRPLPIIRSNPDFAQVVLKQVIEALVEDGFIEEQTPVVEARATA